MIRRVFIRMVKVAGVVLLAVFILWFLPVMLPQWLRDPPELTFRRNEKRRCRRKYKKQKSFYQWFEKEQREREEAEQRAGQIQN